MTLYPKDFSPMALNRVSVVRHATRLFSGIVILIVDGDTGRSLFDVSRHIRLLGEYVGGDGIRISACGKLLISCTGGISTITVIGNLHTISSFSCRFRRTLAGGDLLPRVRAIFLTTGNTGVFLSSDVMGRIYDLGKSVSQFIPGRVLGSIVLEYGKRVSGSWCQCVT